MKSIMYNGNILETSAPHIWKNKILRNKSTARFMFQKI